MANEPSKPSDCSAIELKPSGTILLVDDEDAIRRYCRMVLELDGWNVIEAEDGESAHKLASEHDGEIKVLMTDVMMPGMNGRELATLLWETRPDMKVLFLSGFHEDQMLQAGVEAEELLFLSKPFTPTVLREKLKSMMAEGGA